MNITKKKNIIRNKSVKYNTDTKGRQTAVILPVSLYKKILEKTEDEEDLKIADNISRNSPEYVKFNPEDFK
ncbi:MAG: hypothetical protein NTV87_16295 [Ignavibacteriae bacterium]|nr:hypothetical protein [Ignavibacteriota bacterium]